MTQHVYPVSGTMTADTDAGTLVITGIQYGGAAPVPPDPPPGTNGDAIDMAKAVITDQSPDVRNWPIGSRLTKVMIPPATTDGPADVTNMDVDFTKKNGPGAWPIVMGPEGEIQYTLWVGCLVNGLWYLSGSILCISRAVGDNYVPTGPVLRLGQLPNNWYYYVTGPMRGYQPQPGEQVAWFLTAGVQRRNDIHTVAERTQVVLAPFQAGTWTW